jgi:hypothetical protein
MEQIKLNKYEARLSKYRTQSKAQQIIVHGLQRKLLNIENALNRVLFKREIYELEPSYYPLEEEMKKEDEKWTNIIGKIIKYEKKIKQIKETNNQQDKITELINECDNQQEQYEEDYMQLKEELKYLQSKEGRDENTHLSKKEFKREIKQLKKEIDEMESNLYGKKQIE